LQKASRQNLNFDHAGCQSITGALACAPAALAAPYFSESCAGFYERNPDAQTNCKPVPHSARVKSFK
jgi:hypothetical protein